MPTTQLLGSVGHVGSTWNTRMPADFAGLCAAPGSTKRPTTAITISPNHAQRIIVFRIHAPFIRARGPRRWRAYTRRWRGGARLRLGRERFRRSGVGDASGGYAHIVVEKLRCDVGAALPYQRMKERVDRELAEGSR